MNRVVTIGESMGLIRADGVGGWERNNSAQIDTGGAEANTAIGLARLGIPVTWLGRVGNDALGRRVIGDLRSEGVDVRARVDAEAPTGLMLKSSPRAGVTTVNYYRRDSAGSRLEPSDLDGLALSDGDTLHVTGVTLALSTSARETVFAAVERARQVGALVSFAINHRSRLWGRREATVAYARIIALSDILFASEEEAAMVCTSLEPTYMAREIHSLGPSEVTVTRGSAGAVAVADGEVHRVDAELITALDTVGAGDAFAAGYLAERYSGSEMPKRLRTATRAGAFACLHPGDWQGAIRRDELDAPLTGDSVLR